MGNQPLTPIVIALVTGFEGNITKFQWEILRNTGTNYLVAISGLHIGLVAGFILVFFQFLWRQVKNASLIMPARDVGIIAGLIGGIIYAAIAGFSIPVQRSLIMLIVFGMAALLRRNVCSWRVLLLALFFVLVFNPFAMLSFGFWLSFVAVAAIFYISNWRVKPNTNWCKSFWRIQFAITIILLPLVLYFFQQFSLVSILANIIAMPGICILIVPLSLIGTFISLFSNAISTWILLLSAKLFGFIWYWLTFLAQSKIHSWYHSIYSWWILATTTVSGLFLFSPRGFPVKYNGFIWLLPLFFYVPAKPGHEEVWLTLLDVGQGLAAVIQTANHVLLYDTGPKFFDYDAGNTIVIPYLRSQGIKEIDIMMVSHNDSDHSGGAKSILKTFTVKNILASGPNDFSAYHAKSCYAGQRWNWDGVNFQVLSPFKNSKLIGNEASCVLKVNNDKHSILLTGDIGKISERELGIHYLGNLQSSILIVPHHGSLSSSTLNFINLVKPKYVLFPVGYRNRFHFPNKKVVARYVAANAKLFSTAKNGAIFFKSRSNSDILQPVLYREQCKHFWYNK